MTDLTPTQAMDAAKEASLRFARNHGSLISKQTTIILKQERLTSVKKQIKELLEDEAKLELEIPAMAKHIEQLEEWCANHNDMPTDVDEATVLALKIRKMQKELAKKQEEYDRITQGLLPVVDA